MTSENAKHHLKPAIWILCIAIPSMMEKVRMEKRIAMDTNEIKLSEEINRPSFQELYMDFAFSISRRSTCKRLKVGTVITSTDFRKILSIGYNGNASGLPNTCDSDEPGNCGCLHSEENAVINCDSPRSVEKIVFVTHLPCSACAKRLVNLGNVKSVYYSEDYRKKDSIEILKACKIEVVRIQRHEK